MSDSSLRMRICRTCGLEFLGGPRAWYCPDCRAERKKAQMKEYHQRKNAGNVRKIGSKSKCEICRKKFVIFGGNHRFCEKCSKIHLKAVDNIQSLEWKRNNLEKVKQEKREHSRRKHQAEGKQSGVKYISWDKCRDKWSVIPYVDGKQIYLGRYKDLEAAKARLNEFIDDRTN